MSTTRDVAPRSSLSARRYDPFVHSAAARLFGLAVLLLALTLPPGDVPTAHGASLPNGFVQDPPIQGLTLPIDFDWTPDGRMFVAERGGAVRVVSNGVVLDGYALWLPVNQAAERGLLGLAVDLHFVARPYIYLYYSTSHGNIDAPVAPQNRISRFTVEGNTIDPGSERILVDGIPAEGGHHNGGDLHFGPDGMLYASTGDGGIGPTIWSQDLDSLGGKILRVDPMTGLGPPTNPFAGGNEDRQRVWAFGLRNPFRFGLDAQSGEIIIGDVGNKTYEELDRGVAGANYGWPDVEGPMPPGVAGMTYPFFSYMHAGNADSTFDGCRTVIGGDFMHGTNFPATYEGSYFFGDWWCGRIWTVAPGGTKPVLFLSDAPGIVNLAFGPDGALYYSDLSNIVRVRAVAGNRPPVAHADALPCAGALPLTVSFTSAASTDPDGDVLHYSWDFGDGTTSSAANPSHTYIRPGSFQAVLRVTDAHGMSQSTLPLVIAAGNSAPSVAITAPADGATVPVGSSVTFEASATDPDDGPLADTALTWSVVAHNGPASEYVVARGSGRRIDAVMPMPAQLTTMEDFYLEATVRVVDHYGAAARQSIRVRPTMGTTRFTTEPPGLSLVLGGITMTTPVTITAAVGFHLGLLAPFQTHGECIGYTFSRWSDGQGNPHAIVVAASPQTYTAIFSGNPATCIYLPTVRNSGD